MKIFAIFATAIFCFSTILYAQDGGAEEAPVVDIAPEQAETKEKAKIELAGVSDVPAAKRPKAPD